MEEPLQATLKALRHELRNILSPAMMMAERLTTHEDPKVQRAGKIILEALDKATAEIRRP